MLIQWTWDIPWLAISTRQALLKELKELASKEATCARVRLFVFDIPSGNLWMGWFLTGFTNLVYTLW